METDDSKKEKKETKSQTNTADKKEEEQKASSPTSYQQAQGTIPTPQPQIFPQGIYHMPQQPNMWPQGTYQMQQQPQGNLQMVRPQILPQGTNQMPHQPKILPNHDSKRRFSQGQPFLVKDNKDSMPKQEPPQTDTIQEKHKQNNDFSRSSPTPDQQPQQNQTESSQVPQPQQIQGPGQTPQPQQYYNPQYIPSFSYAYSGKNYPPPLPYNQVVYVQAVDPSQLNSSPIRPGRENKNSSSLPEYTGFTDVEVRKAFVRKVLIRLRRYHGKLKPKHDRKISDFFKHAAETAPRLVS
ncbi:hypothetical protein CDAR_568981 [Caerostris darwini]|uniref:Uncharacterized protein n=1 Tax=Caerostris darwini TaxID=1538125 RepID=A0AAV4QAG6_9ARAC|nr:hypothetical protein CDAR_568981 [Caerostris darwini]